MRSALPFIVIGLTVGAVYAVASLGLVLTYTTSGVFNFAHGAVGMFATYVFYSLRSHVGMAPAMVLAVLVAAPLIGVAIDRLLLRRLAGAPTAAYVVASLGLLVGLQGLASALYGADTRRVEPFFPTSSYRVLGVNVGIDQTMIVGIALVAGIALIVFFRRTLLGLQTRAVVDDRALAGLAGTNAAGVTTLSWMIGCAFAATSGILIAPVIGLDSLLLTLLVVQAFGAAIIGRLRSFPLTMLAAFGLGVAQSLVTKMLSDFDVRWLAGLPNALPFVALFIVLVFSRPGSFTELTTTLAAPRGRQRRRRQAAFPAVPLAVAVAVAAALPAVLNGSRLLTLTMTVAFVLVFSSLSLLVGLSRQVSLAHAVFVVLGATTLSHLLSAGLPYLLALLLAGLVVVPIGAAMAIPSMRLSGLFLALATFGFGVLAQNFIFPTGLTFGSQGVAIVGRPAAFSGDTAFYYLVLGIATAGILAVEFVRVTRMGRVLMALGDSPTAVRSLGINPLATRVITFCLSAFLAALAGGLIGSLVHSVTPASFHFFQSLIWVTVLVAAGARSFGGSVLAAVLLVAAPAVFTSSTVTEWQPVLFGMAAMLLAQADNGLIGLWRVPDFAALAGPARERLRSTRAVERYLADAARRLAPSKATTGVEA